MDRSSFATQPRRRLMVVLVAVSLIGYMIGDLLDNPLLTLISLLAFLGGALLLRLTTQGVADLPDAALDERQVSVRNSAYLRAYRVLGGAVALVVIGMFVWELLKLGPVPVATVQLMTTSCLFLAMVAPSCVVAWWEKEG